MFIVEALVTFFGYWLVQNLCQYIIAVVFPSGYGSIEVHVETLVLGNLYRKGFDELFWQVCPH